MTNKRLDNQNNSYQCIKQNVLLSGLKENLPMKITIKHLSKHEVFAALYNYTAEFVRTAPFSATGFAMGTERISLIRAEQIITAQLGLKKSLYFDYFNATLFQKDQKQADYGNQLHIDLSQDVIESEKFDAVYGPGKCEKLINDLRKDKIVQLKVQLSPDEDWVSAAFGALPPSPKNPEELTTILLELEVQVQQYERIVSLERKLNDLIKKKTLVPSELKHPFFPLLLSDSSKPKIDCQPPASAMP